jgi:tetratricopeptide (TPR) repeat protein
VLSQALAEMYQRTNDNDKAIAEYENLLKKSPNDAVAANNLASLLAETKGDKASLERALELTKRFEHARNPSFLDTLGRVYFKLGQNDHALPLLQKAAASAPQAPVYQYHVGLALYKKGDMESAKTHLQQAVDAKVNFAGIEEAKEILAKL